MTRILVQRGSSSSSSSNQNLSSTSVPPSPSTSSASPQQQVVPAIKYETLVQVQEQNVVDETSEHCGVSDNKSEDVSLESLNNDPNEGENLEEDEALPNDEVVCSGNTVKVFGGLSVLHEETDPMFGSSFQKVSGTSYPPLPPVPPPKPSLLNSPSRRSPSIIGPNRRASILPGVSSRSSPTGSRPSSPRSHRECEGYNSADEQSPSFSSSYDDAIFKSKDFRDRISSNATVIASDDEDEILVHFLESEVLSELSDQEEIEREEEERRDAKRSRIEDGKVSELYEEEEKEQQEAKKIRIDEGPGRHKGESKSIPKRIETGIFCHVPPELLYHILKFLSSEDLVSCSLVCRFLNFAASDESLWRRLYCMRWGLLLTKRPRECAWKKLYIQRDVEDMAEFVRNCPSEFKEYYIQMQVAKRSQAPNRTQVNDDRIILDKTLADQVSMWKSSRGLAETGVLNHACSGENCAYYQIGDVFVCEKTGNVHVCDDTCKEVIMDPTNELLVCTISGRCFDRILLPAEMEPDVEQQQGGVGDEAEPFMGSGRFARAYLLGYNCQDEKELEAALRFC